MECQAPLVDRQVFGIEDTVPPCDDLAAYEILGSGLYLCEGCKEALEALAGLGDACLRAMGDEQLEQLRE